MKIRTAKAGRSYYVTDPNGLACNFALDVAAGVVVVTTKTSNLGGYRIERFGGELSPASIRGFYERNGEAP